MSSMSPEDEEVIILETREASPSHFLLKIESFSLLGEHGFHRYVSGEFNAGGHKWRLIVYPNEDKTGKDKDYISVYLAISDKTSLYSEVNAVFSIFVLDQNLSNYHYSPGRTRRFMAVQSEWGISKFISKKVLNDPSNGFILNDKCVFGVEVFIVGMDKNMNGRCSSTFFKRLLDFADCFTLSHVKDQTNDEHECSNKTVGLELEGTILETREAFPTHFLMKPFSLLGNFNSQIGEFDAGGYKWRLTICPNEDKSGIESKYVSVYLTILDANSLQPANWEVNAVFSIFLFNQISLKYHHSLGRTRRFLAMKPEWGISDFISKKALMDPSNGFLVNNNCVFGAEVFIVENAAMSECLSMKNVTIPYKREWKISNFSQLGKCWTSSEFVVQDLKWDILLYPKELNHEKSVGIYLQLKDSKRVKASLSICIKDQINKKHKIYTDSCWFSPTSKSWGWASMMELSTLEDPEKGFIVNDCIHLEIELSVQAVI